MESFERLEPDQTAEITQLLRLGLQNNYILQGSHINSTIQLPNDDFKAPSWVLHVNKLWFASLVFSLGTASLAMLIKQWLREYLAVEFMLAPQQRFRARCYRRPALDKWQVFNIAALLPLLLNTSLALFFAGLCIFTTSVDPHLGHSTLLPLVCAWGLVVVFTIVAPLFSPRCPFKVPFLGTVVGFLRREVVRKLCCGIGNMWHIWPSYGKHYRPAGFGGRIEQSSSATSTYWEEEEDAVNLDKTGPLPRRDYDNLLFVDEQMTDDQLLGNMCNVVARSKAPLQSIIYFALKAVEHRGVIIPSSAASTYISMTHRESGFRGPNASAVDTQSRLVSIVDLHSLSQQASDVLMEIIARAFKDTCTANVPGEPLSDRIPDAIRFLLSKPRYPFPAAVRIILTDGLALQSMLLAVQASQLEPHETVQFICLILNLHCDPQKETITSITSVADLQFLSHEAWDIVMSMVSRALEWHTSGPTAVKTLDGGGWTQDAVYLLLSKSLYPFPKPVTDILSTDLLFVVCIKTVERLALEPEIVIDYAARLLLSRAPSNTISAGDNLMQTLLSVEYTLALLPIKKREALVGMVASCLHAETGSWAKDESGKRPEWAADAATILLLLNARRRINSDALSALKDFLDCPQNDARARGFELCDAGRLLASRLMPGLDSTQFISVSEWFLPVLHETKDDKIWHECLLNVLNTYASLLWQQTGSKIQQNTRTAWPLWLILREHPELFTSAQARPILLDLYMLLEGVAKPYLKSRNDGFKTGPMIGMEDVFATLMEFGLRLDEVTASATDIWKEFGTSKIDSVRGLCVSMLASASRRASACFTDHKGFVVHEFIMYAFIHNQLGYVEGQNLTHYSLSKPS